VQRNDEFLYSVYGYIVVGIEQDPAVVLS